MKFPFCLFLSGQMDWLPNIVRQYLLSFIQYPVIICCPPRKSERISEKRFSFLTIISPDELLFFLAFMSYHYSNSILTATIMLSNKTSINAMQDLRFKSAFEKCSVFHLLARVFRKHKAKWYFAELDLFRCSLQLMRTISRSGSRFSFTVMRFCKKKFLQNAPRL